MKIDLNLAGSASAVPDYDMLKAALLAAQAATPTAKAARETRREPPAREALEQILGDVLASSEVASALAHRFAPEIPDAGETA